MKQNIRTAMQLAEHLTLSDQEMQEINTVCEQYPMAITDHYLNLIDPEDPEDPVRRMSVPSAQELDVGGDSDPSGEACNTVLSGLQHKYTPTVLFLSTNTCRMYCRYCFRKRLVGLSSEQLLQGFEEAIRYVRAHEEVNNVLVSGGDPLTIDPSLLAQLLEGLADIEHLDFIRIGSRIPVVDPDWMLDDPDLMRVLEDCSARKPLYLVTHVNHPRELTAKTIRCVDRLRERDILVSNQTVLLRGVNDDPRILIDLMRSLVRARILPYYVFQCRPVKGAKAHFQVPLIEGAEIVESAKHALNGHEKRFRYCMSHRSGKIEILGRGPKGSLVLKYHEAKNEADSGRIFLERVSPDQCWL